MDSVVMLTKWPMPELIKNTLPGKELEDPDPDQTSFFE